MKTIITSSENNASAKFDMRFGRAKWYCFIDEDTKQTEFFENLNINASNGAGVKAAEKMVELGAQKVISGHFGPKAKDLLEKFNIQMVVLSEEEITIQQIIQNIKN